MHIIHTIGSLGEWGGGPVRSVTQLCDALASNGIGVSILAGYDRERDLEIVRPKNPNVKVFFSEAFAVGGQRFFPRFKKHLQGITAGVLESSPKVCIHDHGLWSQTNLASSQVATQLGLPYILSPRGAMEEWAMQYKRWKKFLAWHLYQRRIIERTSVFVAASDKEARSIAANAAFPKIVVIENGVHMPPAKGSVQTFHDRRQRTILFLSRIHPVKNLGVLLHAWSQVQDQVVAGGWKLQISGPDELDHRSTLESLARELGVTSTVEFTGAVRDGDKSALFNTTDLFVMPSLSENFSVTVAEALAHCVPVIASTGTPWQALVLNRCGWWVAPTAEAFSDALRAAMSLSDSERKKMGIAGRMFVDTSFGWNSIATRMSALYASAMQSHGSAR